MLTHLAVAVLAAAAAVGVTLEVDHPAGSSGASLPGAAEVPSPPAAPPGGTAAGGSEQQVVNKVEPGLAVITADQQYNSEAGAGTGMIINPDGLVLTNNHVIAGATKITATDVATGKTYPATVVGYDKTADIALIQLRGATGLHTIPVGNSATVRTGDPVVALGNAEGQGTIIPAAGQVTATGQTITAADQGGTAGEFTLSGRAMRNVRQMASRAGRHGYAAEVRRVRDIPRRELDQIRTAAASWRGGPVERGFSMALGRVGPGSRGSSCSQADATRRASRWPRCRPRPSWPGPSWKPAATPGASRGGSAPPGHPAGPGTARHRGRGWQRMP